MNKIKRWAIAFASVVALAVANVHAELTPYDAAADIDSIATTVNSLFSTAIGKVVILLGAAIGAAGLFWVVKMARAKLFGRG